MKDVSDQALAAVAVGAAVVESLKIYMDTAPSLKDIRSAVPGDDETRQLILDADMLGLIVVVAIGGAGLATLRRWSPLLIASAVLLLVSAYYRSVLNSSNERMRNGTC